MAVRVVGGRPAPFPVSPIRGPRSVRRGGSGIGAGIASGSDSIARAIEQMTSLRHRRKEGEKQRVHETGLAEIREKGASERTTIQAEENRYASDINKYIGDLNAQVEHKRIIANERSAQLASNQETVRTLFRVRAESAMTKLRIAQQVLDSEFEHKATVVRMQLEAQTEARNTIMQSLIFAQNTPERKLANEVRSALSVGAIAFHRDARKDAAEFAGSEEKARQAVIEAASDQAAIDQGELIARWGDMDRIDAARKRVLIRGLTEEQFATRQFSIIADPTGGRETREKQRTGTVAKEMYKDFSEFWGSMEGRGLPIEEMRARMGEAVRKFGEAIEEGSPEVLPGNVSRAPDPRRAGDLYAIRDKLEADYGVSPIGNTPPSIGMIAAERALKNLTSVRDAKRLSPEEKERLDKAVAESVKSTQDMDIVTTLEAEAKKAGEDNPMIRAMLKGIIDEDATDEQKKAGVEKLLGELGNGKSSDDSEYLSRAKQNLAEYSQSMDVFNKAFGGVTWGAKNASEIFIQSTDVSQGGTPGVPPRLPIDQPAFAPGMETEVPMMQGARPGSEGVIPMPTVPGTGTDEVSDPNDPANQIQSGAPFNLPGMSEDDFLQRAFNGKFPATSFS